MKLFVFVVLAACACGAFTKRVKKADDKVKIAVYYESLCPDSKKFITTQLAPVWKDLRGAVKVKLVPYGKATHEKVDGKWKFTCHHGVEECNGNKIQACILKDSKLGDSEKIDMVVCLMNQANPDKELETCLRQTGRSDEFNKIKTCAESEQGDNLLALFGDKSDALMKPLQSVPTIVINEKFESSYQEEAFNNLKALVCRVSTKTLEACN